MSKTSACHWFSSSHILPCAESWVVDTCADYEIVDCQLIPLPYEKCAEFAPLAKCLLVTATAARRNCL